MYIYIFVLFSLFIIVSWDEISMYGIYKYMFKEFVWNKERNVNIGI